MSTTRISRVRVDHRGCSDRGPNKLSLAAVLGLIAAGILAVSANPARAGEAFHTTSIGGLSLPEFIGPLEFIGEHSGPEGDRSASYSYRSFGLALEISVTDLGAEGVADGIAAPQLLERFSEAKQDLIAATKVRRLKARHEKNVALGHEADARVAREALYTVKPRGDEGGSTYLIFTAAHGLVIDARFDIAPGLEEEGLLSHGEILEALGDAIPASAAPVLAARARAAAEAEAAAKVAIVWDPATPEQESRIWLAYLFARAAFAVGESSEGPAAGEREASFEEELRGRTTAVNMFRALKHNDAQLASAYFNDIDRVEAAGYLREYVWRYLRQTAWKTPPAGLDLAGFDSWRATHLPHHIAITHGRIAFRTPEKNETRGGS